MLPAREPESTVRRVCGVRDRSEDASWRPQGDLKQTAPIQLADGAAAGSQCHTADKNMNVKALYLECKTHR